MTDPANLITFMLKVKTKIISVKDLLLRSLPQQKQGDLLMMGSYLTLESTQLWILYTESKMIFTISVISCVVSC